MPWSPEQSRTRRSSAKFATFRYLSAGFTPSHSFKQSPRNRRRKERGSIWNRKEGVKRREESQFRPRTYRRKGDKDGRMEWRGRPLCGHIPRCSRTLPLQGPDGHHGSLMELYWRGGGRRRQLQPMACRENRGRGGFFRNRPSILNPLKWEREGTARIWAIVLYIQRFLVGLQVYSGNQDRCTRPDFERDSHMFCWNMRRIFR